MDVRDWGMAKLMQLPDWCFGERWPIITCNTVAVGQTEQWIVEKPVPDRIVLWSVRVFGSQGDIATSWIKFALGDHEPANDAEFDAFERLFKGDFDRSIQEGAFPVVKYADISMTMRKPLEMNGRRFAIQMSNNHGSVSSFLAYVFEVSSVPSEVPDWLISDQANEL